MGKWKQVCDRESIECAEHALCNYVSIEGNEGPLHCLLVSAEVCGLGTPQPSE